MLPLLILAASAIATPAPAATPLQQLKIIGNVRSTPFCTSLRQVIGPAVAGILSNDELIASSQRAFAQLYRDDTLTPSGFTLGDSARAHFDVYRLEKLIGPIEANLKQIDHLLSANPSDPRITAMRAKLQEVEKQQKDSLNVVSGIVATEQLGEIQNGGLPDNWKGVFSAVPQPRAPSGALSTTPAASTNVFSAGVHPMKSSIPQTDPRYNPQNVGLTYDAFGPFAEQIEQQRVAAQSSESDAADLISSALQQCAP